MPYNRRTILKTVAGGTALAATGMRPTLAAARTAGDAASGNLQSLSRPAGDPVTLEGTVSTAPVTTEEGVLVGSTRGLFHLVEGELDAFVPTRPVRRIVPIEAGRAVVLVEDHFFPNVLAVETTAGEIAWSQSRKTAVYSQEFGQIERQVGVFDATGIGDTTGNGTPDVGVATGYGVSAYDGDTGEELWTLDHGFYAWRVAALDGTVYATTQDGNLLAIDAGSGTLDYEVTLAEPFDGIERSVWDLSVADEQAGHLAVTTEDGYVKLVDAADGSVRWETQVLEPDDADLTDYYRKTGSRPTMPGGPDSTADGNFFNVELTPVEGEGFLLTTSAVPTSGPAGSEASTLAFVTVNGDLQWENDSVGLDTAGNVHYSAEVDGERVFVPTVTEQAKQAVTSVSLADGTQTETVTFETVPGADHSRQGGVSYLASRAGRLAVAPDTGDFLAADPSGEVAWSFPSARDCRVLAAEFLESGTDDYLVYSQNKTDSGVTSRTLIMRSGADGSVDWSRTLGVGEYFDDGGLGNLTVTDGPASDVIAIEQAPTREDSERRQELEDQIGKTDTEIDQKQQEIERLENEKEQPGGRPDAEIDAEIDRLQAEVDDLTAERDDLLSELESLGGQQIAALVALSGRDGTERWRLPIAFDRGSTLPAAPRPVSLDTFGDDRSFILGLGDRLLLLEEREDEFLWTDRSYGRGPDDDGDLWPPVGDRNVRYRTLSGPAEQTVVVAISSRNNAFAILEATHGDSIGDVEFTKRSEFSLGEGRLLSRTIESLGDINGDGYGELLCRIDEGGVQRYVVISPAEGGVIKRIESEDRRTPTVTQTVAPDGEGPGLVTFTGREDRFTVTVCDGLDEQFSHQQTMRQHRSQESGYRPAALAGDIDGDGTEEVAVAKSAIAGGARVEFFDVATGDRVDELVLQAFADRVDPEEDDLQPAKLVTRLPGKTDDGKPALGIVVGQRDGPDRFYVVDPTDPAVLVSGSSEGGEFVPLADSVGLVGRDASLRSVDPSAGVTLEQPTANSPTVLRWTFDDDIDRVTRVSVNDHPVTITTERSTEVRLPAGSHTVELESTSPDGLTVHDSASLTLEKGSVTDVALYGLAGVSVAALFGVSLADRLRRRVRS